MTGAAELDLAIEQIDDLLSKLQAKTPQATAELGTTTQRKQRAAALKEHL